MAHWATERRHHALEWASSGLEKTQGGWGWQSGGTRQKRGGMGIAGGGEQEALAEGPVLALTYGILSFSSKPEENHRLSPLEGTSGGI